MSEEKIRYTKEELAEFEELILAKLESAKVELNILLKSIKGKDETGTASITGKLRSLEDGAGTAEKEHLNQLASRQEKFIKNLKDALIRIKNGTYGICSVSGKLISKERLRAVPHTTQSIESKLNANK